MSTAADGLAGNLLQVLAGREPGLTTLYAILDVVVADLGLRGAAVVIDEPPFSQQLFRAGRVLGPEDGVLALGSPGLYAEPPVDPAGAVARVVADACRLAVRSLEQATIAAGPSVPAVPDLRERFDAAAAHASRAGCAFAFVLVVARSVAEHRELAFRLADSLRRDDTICPLPDAQFGLLLPLARGDRVAGLLERTATSRFDGDPLCPPFTYSVVICPREAVECDTAVSLARERHRSVQAALDSGAENHTIVQ